MTGLPTPADLELFQAGDPGLNLDAALAAVRSYCGWRIGPEITETVTVDGSGAAVLLLPTLHLVDVVSVTEDGTSLDVTDLEWSQAGFLRGTSLWTTKLRGVAVEMTHGHPVLPTEVAAVVLGLAAAGSANGAGRLRQVGQVAYDVTGAGSATGFTATELTVLDRYKIPVLA